MINIYPLLLSHISVIFPISICLFTIKKFKSPQAILMVFQLFFNLVFSFMYHLYDYSNIIINDKVGYESWSILDHNSSSITIVCTALYLSVYSDNMFFILSYIIYNFMLINRLIPYNPFSTYMVIIFSSICTLVKFNNIINYFKNFWILSTLTLFSTIFSTFCFYYALDYDYGLWHSLWHLFVFTTAGLCYLLRYKYEKKKEVETIIY
jgi:hypothetical protein